MKKWSSWRNGWLPNHPHHQQQRESAVPLRLVNREHQGPLLQGLGQCLLPWLSTNLTYRWVALTIHAIVCLVPHVQQYILWKKNHHLLFIVWIFCAICFSAKTVMIASLSVPVYTLRFKVYDKESFTSCWNYLLHIVLLSQFSICFRSTLRKASSQSWVTTER